MDSSSFRSARAGAGDGGGETDRQLFEVVDLSFVARYRALVKLMRRITTGKRSKLVKELLYKLKVISKSIDGI